MTALWALPSGSSHVLPWDYAGGQPRGSVGNPKVILLATFVDLAKKNFVTNGRAHRPMDKQMCWSK